MIVTRTFHQSACGALVVTVLLAFGPSAYAQSSAGSASRPTSLFHKLDANNDGKVTFEEYVAYRDGVIWKLYDPNNTGKVSRRAYTQGSHTQAIDFRRMDANHNNILEKSEFDTETKRLFDRRDRRKDGILTVDEFEKPRTRSGAK